MNNQIKTWLTKTGYPLEMFVHKTLLAKNYLCEKSPIYSDIELGVAREIDLTAYHHGMYTDDYSYSIQLVIECKKSDKPLIVLCDSNSLNERYEHFFGNDVISHDGPNAGFLAYVQLRELTHDQRLENIGSFSKPVYSGYSVIPAFSKSDENIYKGIMGLASANDYYRKEYYDFFQSVRNNKTLNTTDRNPFQLQMPVLVVDSSLYNAYLKDDGETIIEETDWSSISISLPWLLGRDDRDRRCNIQIIKKDALSLFLDSLGQLHEYISRPEVVSSSINRITKPNMKQIGIPNLLHIFRR